MNEAAMEVDDDDIYWAAPDESIDVVSDDEYKKKIQAKQLLGQ